MRNESIGKIFLRNTLTLFNIINLVLAGMIIAVGSYKNLTFIVIAIANTLISIVNEIRAKKIVDKMRLLSEQQPTVIRDGAPRQVPAEAVEKNDIVVLSLGDQIMFDSVVQEGYLEVNEAFITGEQDNLEKRPGDKLTSGSFVVAGTAKAKVTAVGAENFVNKLNAEARTIKTADSKLFKLMNNIVKYISYALIPIGALLLWSRFRVDDISTTEAVTSTAASLLSMIPEGLILLTSSVLALATIRLSRRQVLVQDLYSIETLARVDTICLDKTGTLTTGRMTVHDFTATTRDEKSFLRPLAAVLSHQMTENDTVKALKQKFLKTAKFKATSDFAKIEEVIPFSSDRKYSGIKTKNAEYLMGAIEFITDDKETIKQVKTAAGDYRAIAIAKKTDEKTTLLGYVRLEDEFRKDAPEIIQYFYDNDVAVKIISGDDLPTVVGIAEKVGVKDLRGVDLSEVEKPNYDKLVKEYAIFTRVKPAQKKQLVKALRASGATVAMTGDGVNDILAMKEADVSLAIGEGSDAARRAARLVLLNSDFAAVPSIIDEGRQSINNLERSTALFLAKTVYASILAVVFIFLPFKSPYASPIQMALLNVICIGLPGLILALEKNTARPKDRFKKNVVQYSVPVGITISIAMLIIAALAHFDVFPEVDLNTAALFITFVIDILLIYWISRPLNLLRGSLLAGILLVMVAAYLIPFAHKFFDFVWLTQPGLIVTLSVMAGAVILFLLLRLFIKRRLDRK